MIELTVPRLIYIRLPKMPVCISDPARAHQRAAACSRDLATRIQRGDTAQRSRASGRRQGRKRRNAKKRRVAKQQPNRAKRLECVELAPAVERDGVSKAGASSTHSKRFATKAAAKSLAAWQQLGPLQCGETQRRQNHGRQNHGERLSVSDGLRGSIAALRLSDGGSAELCLCAKKLRRSGFGASVPDSITDSQCTARRPRARFDAAAGPRLCEPQHAPPRMGLPERFRLRFAE